MSNWNQWGLMDAASPIIEEFVYLHGFILVILAILLLIGAIKLYILLEEQSKSQGGILGGGFGGRGPNPPWLLVILACLVLANRLKKIYNRMKCRTKYFILVILAILLLIGAIKLYMLEQSSTQGGIIGGVLGEIRPSLGEWLLAAACLVLAYSLIKIFSR